MYTITIDRDQRFVDVTLAGLMTIEEVAGYIGELRGSFAVNGIQAGYRMMIDVSACPIQTQDMIRAMGLHMASMPKAGAIAVVTGSSLARMQARRLFTQSYARVVATREDGRAWALAGTEPEPEAPGTAHLRPAADLDRPIR